MTACVTVVIAAQVIVLLFGGILVSLGDFLMCERLLLSSHVVLFFFSCSLVPPSAHLFHTLAEDAASSVQM